MAAFAGASTIPINPFLVLPPMPPESSALPIESKQIDLEGLILEVLADKHDVVWYQQRKTFEEKVSLLYQFIRNEGFAQFVDIGANVGLITLLAKHASPRLHCLALEADPRLVELMQRNLRRHKLDDITVLNAIVGPEDQKDASFSLNPGSTLDNRVNVAGWEQVQVPMVRMATVLAKSRVAGKTFIKIDTQGFEYGVLQGLMPWLKSHSEWVIKMEFAPDWLRSQGTDPLELLTYLQDEHGFEISECAERVAFGTPNIDALFSYPLTRASRAAFLLHVVALNKGGLGWVDLLVRPRKKKWGGFLFASSEANL